MYFDDITIGLTTEIAPAVIEKQKMIDFALLYDNIPLHTDEEYAKNTTSLKARVFSGGAENLSSSLNINATTSMRTASVM